MRKMKTMKKLLVWLLVCAMFVTLAPSSALAAVEEETVEAINVTDEEEAAKDDIVVEEEVEEEEVSQDVEAPAAEADIAEPEAEDDMDDIVQVFEDTDDYSIKADGDDPAPDAAPKTTKTVEPNKNADGTNDGTYKITLDIEGKIEHHEDITKANVIIVFDRSGSMKESAGSTTRLAAAKTAVNSVAKTLLDMNGADGAPSDLVELALISFSTNVNVGNKTVNLSNFQNTVNNLTADGGTNWEAALEAAKDFSFGDSDPTYVIFVSDGNPTFHAHDEGYGDYSNRYGVYGDGQEGATNVKRCYDSAIDDARDIVATKGYKFYTIGAYGNVDRMEGLTNYAYTGKEGTPPEGTYYYPASNTEALNNALKAIASAIIENLGQSDVSTTDGITDLSDLKAKVSGTASGFEYFKKTKDASAFSSWADAPKAEYKDGDVVWDLSSEKSLEDGTVYRIQFDVWPSQEAYDTLADLNNGLIEYGETVEGKPDTTHDDNTLTDDERAQIVTSAAGGYALLTNTHLFTKYTYNGESATKNFDHGSSAMELVSEQLSVKKVWDNALDSRVADSISLILNKDGKPYLEGDHAITVADPTWEKNDIFIAPGVMRGGEILEPGHDYELIEKPSDAYYWELEAAVYHPMVIDGKLTILKADDNGTITINNKKYAAVDSSGSTLTATNHRRSNLNLKKVVEDNTAGKVAPEDAKFGYKINIVNSNAANEDQDKEVWFSVVDAEGKRVVDITTNAEPEMKDGAKTGYYMGESGKDITVELQADWNLRVTNLPSGSEYTIEETTMPGGFEFKEIKSDTTTQTVSGQKVTGKIDEWNKSYQVTNTNSFQGFFYVYHTSMTGSDAGVIEAISMKPYNEDSSKTFDIFAKTANGTYYGGYYDNYYYAGKVDIETDPAKPTVTGGTKYEGQAVGFYKTKATAYTVPGTAMKPVAGTVYYLKEVPTSYINAKVYVRYNSKDHLSEPNKVNKIEPITCIDDKNYTEQGFYFNTDKLPVKDLASVFIETKEGKQTRNENGTSLFGTPNKGYLAIDDYTSKIKAKSTNTIQPYWITLDKIEVKGTQKTITVSGDLVYPGVDVK